jgi:hypothetical protein
MDNQQQNIANKKNKEEEKKVPAPISFHQKPE